MKILFKYPRLKQEWITLLRLNPKLVFIVLYLADRVQEITITEIFRTEKMQRVYYPDNKTSESVHQYWRGVDGRMKGYNNEKHNNAIAEINSTFPYGKKRIQTALIHNIGKGNHWHLQTII